MNQLANSVAVDINIFYGYISLSDYNICELKFMIIK